MAGTADEDNILSTLLAKQMGAGRVVTLAMKKVYLPVVSAIGVDRVVSIRMAAVDKILVDGLPLKLPKENTPI